MSNEELVSWTLSYLKYKDAVLKKYKELSSKKESVDAVLKSGGTEKYLCFNSLEDLDVSKISKEKIVCLNKKSNLEWLFKNWSLVNTKDCTFLFVNPKKSESWAIYPKNHHGITDKVALKPGLNSLFNSISEVK